MKDPIKALLNVGWTFSEARFSPRCRRELLRAKGLSLLCENVGVPISSACAKYIHRITCDVTTPRFSGMSGSKSYEEEAAAITEDRVASSVAAVVHPSDRVLVERVYGIPIQTQLAIESYFDHCNIVQPIPARLLWGLAPENAWLYAGSHVHRVEGSPEFWKR
jgi:hypothetical protein